MMLYSVPDHSADVAAAWLGLVWYGAALASGSVLPLAAAAHTFPLLPRC